MIPSGAARALELLRRAVNAPPVDVAKIGIVIPAVIFSRAVVLSSYALQENAGQCQDGQAIAKH